MIVKNEKHEVCVTVRIPVYLKHRLEALSEEKDWSLSHVVCHILMLYFYPTPEYLSKMVCYVSFLLKRNSYDACGSSLDDNVEEV